MPSTPWLWSQHWLDVLFAHWPVPVAELRSQVPAGLDIDTWEETAWVSLVAFRLERIRRRWLPPIAFLTNSLELNLRTYVRYQGEPAIFFLSIQAGTRLLVRLARGATPLPYDFARMSYVRRDESIQFQSHLPAEAGGLSLTASYAPSARGQEVRPGSLDDWLLERYCLYVPGAQGTFYRTMVQHPPWQVQDVKAHLAADMRGRPFGFDPARGLESAHYSAGVQAHIWPFAVVKPGESCPPAC